MQTLEYKVFCGYMENGVRFLAQVITNRLFLETIVQWDTESSTALRAAPCNGTVLCPAGPLPVGCPLTLLMLKTKKPHTHFQNAHQRVALSPLRTAAVGHVTIIAIYVGRRTLNAH